MYYCRVGKYHKILRPDNVETPEDPVGPGSGVYSYSPTSLAGRRCTVLPALKAKIISGRVSIFR